MIFSFWCLLILWLLCRWSLDFLFWVFELCLWFWIGFSFFVWCSKTSLKLAVSRIKLLKNRREAQLKQMKRDLAQLLQSGQDQTARIRVLCRSVLVQFVLKSILLELFDLAFYFFEIIDFSCFITSKQFLVYGAKMWIFLLTEHIISGLFHVIDCCW